METIAGTIKVRTGDTPSGPMEYWSDMLSQWAPISKVDIALSLAQGRAIHYNPKEIVRDETGR